MKSMTLPTIIAAGIYNAQVASRGRDITKNRKTTMFELELPLEDGGVSYINSQSCPIQRHTIICAKPGQMRHTRLPFLCRYVHFIVHEGTICDILLGMPNFIDIQDISKIEAIFADIIRFHESGLEQDKVMLGSAILSLIYQLFEQGQYSVYRDKLKSNNKKTIERAIAYIQDNLTGDLRLETVAEHVAFSPIHFHNCFKASTGMTLCEYVTDQRIKKAINLLISTDLTLSEIAYECGFSSQSYFSYAFKKAMGMTPRQYEKEIYQRYDQS